MPVIASALFAVIAIIACYERTKIFGKLSSLVLFVMIVALPLTALVGRLL